MKNGPYTLVLAPDGYPGKRYRGKYCYEHILVFWQTHGRMPKPGHIVHHANENPRDNDPENLEEVFGGYHVAMHTAVNKPKRFAKLFCTQCKGEFYRELRQLKKGARPFCSRECFATSLKTI
jgi:HNH endonuclease